MAKSPLILAALATDAAPTLNFNSVKPIGNPDGLFESALLTESSTGLHYTIKMPRNKVAGLALDTELAVIRSFTEERRARLPFEITKLIGSTTDVDGLRAMVFSFVYGEPIDLGSTSADDPLTESIGKALAAIHNLPSEIVENAGLPSYSVQDSIRIRVAELDKARETGRLPRILNDRWEQAFEDVSLFRYQPCVIHNDLMGESMLELDGQVSGVLHWTGLRIGDPAEDFAWILGSENYDAAYSVLLAYQSDRPAADPNIKQRATLYSELQIVRWLMFSLKNNDDENVNAALEMLMALAQEVEDGRAPSLSTVPLTQQAPAATSQPENVWGEDSRGSFVTSNPLPTTDTGSFEMPIISEGAFAVEEAEEAVTNATRPIAIVTPEADDLSDSQVVNDSPIDEIASVEVAIDESDSSSYDERQDQTKPAKDDELF